VNHAQNLIRVELETVRPRILAAVRREIPASEVGSAWKPALDSVWDYLRGRPGIRTDGHNIFLYHSKTQSELLECDFGVEVSRIFEASGEVYATETPGGEVALAVHRGPYSRLKEAYHAIDQWMAANHRESAGYSWEIYGDPTPNPADTETTVVHLLK
jgi:effector-binding domain-containing protein